ncbi:hypothetical protein I6F26_24020 [Ensifer sp. IC3342]|nr:hypothetical protein [Ensifer sp. BRP08]MCA1449646.1 hypothetical protein [Ensifer sp. IC3342]
MLVAAVAATAPLNRLSRLVRGHRGVGVGDTHWQREPAGRADRFWLGSFCSSECRLTRLFEYNDKMLGLMPPRHCLLHECIRLLGDDDADFIFEVFGQTTVNAIHLGLVEILPEQG